MQNLLKTAEDPLPPVVAVRPMLMLTGFLGAGKTTLLRSILDDLASRGYLSDVILNDRENAQIDRETLKDHADSVAALTGSCVCCEGMDELYDMILAASKSVNQVLIIELNGTADPLPLLEGFTLLEGKFLLHPRWQVCVVDARNFGKHTRFRELKELQLETASHYYLSQTSKLTEAEKRELVQEVESINSQASRTSAFALANSLSQVISKNSRHRLARRPVTQQPDSWAQWAPDSQNSSHNHHERHHFAHEFTGCTVVIPEAVKASQVIAWLKKLPSSIIRAKALVTLITEPDIRYLYERVGMDVSPRALPVHSVAHAPCSGLFIGPDLQPSEILKLTREVLHPYCYLPEK